MLNSQGGIGCAFTHSQQRSCPILKITGRTYLRLQRELHARYECPKVSRPSSSSVRTESEHHLVSRQLQSEKAGPALSNILLIVRGSMEASLYLTQTGATVFNFFVAGGIVHGRILLTKPGTNEVKPPFFRLKRIRYIRHCGHVRDSFCMDHGVRWTYLRSSRTIVGGSQ